MNIKTRWQELKNRYETSFNNRAFLYSFFVSLIFLVVSLFVNFYAGLYATERASSSVTDIILSNIPVYDVDVIFAWGALLLVIAITMLCLYEPKRAPFILKTIALFVVIRSGFLTLTHIGPFPDQVALDSLPNFLSKFTFGGDLFFSGHTGLPFLVALLYWNRRYIRVVFVLTSVLFAITVLLGHLHYSIDVAAAYFITYTIFALAKVLFERDWQIFINQKL